MINHNSIIAQTNDPFESFDKHHPVVPEASDAGLFLIIFILIIFATRRKLSSRNKE